MRKRRDYLAVTMLLAVVLAWLVTGGPVTVQGQTGSGYFLRICSSTTQCHTVPIVASDTLALLAGTQTFTNKTLDAEATGNVLTVPEKIWFRAALCQNVTPVSEWSMPVTNPAVATCITGTNTQTGTLDFADGANSLSIQRTLMLPTDFTGTVDLRLKWFAGTAITGAVVWQAATICTADAETGDPAFNTASTVTDTVKGTVNQDNDATITTVTITGCAAGELMFLKVFRDPANVADTMADTARLRGVEVTYRRAS